MPAGRLRPRLAGGAPRSAARACALGHARLLPQVKRLHAKVQELVERGKSLGTGGGSFEATQRNALDLAEAEAALKAARRASKDDKQLVKALARDSMSAANWTAAVLSGEDARFARGEVRASQHAAAHRQQRRAARAARAARAGCARWFPDAPPRPRIARSP